MKHKPKEGHEPLQSGILELPFQITVPAGIQSIQRDAVLHTESSLHIRETLKTEEYHENNTAID